MNIRQNYKIKECQRCGTCCKKGGPSLHIEDKNLVKKGIIPLKRLFTIRKGEPANDNVKESINAAATDIIKIKGQGNSLICKFFNNKDKVCQIYENRPVECRVLKCWDTREIEQIYSKNRLVRKDLIGNIDGLWDLVTEHQQRCDYEIIKSFISIENSDNQTGSIKGADSIKELGDLINYEKHIRLLIIERGGLDSGILNFLFGRPLTETLKMFGLEVKQNGDRTVLKNLRLGKK